MKVRRDGDESERERERERVMEETFGREGG